MKSMWDCIEDSGMDASGRGHCGAADRKYALFALLARLVRRDLDEALDVVLVL